MLLCSSLGLWFPKGPSPKNQACQNSQHLEMNPQSGIAIKVALQNLSTHNPQTRIEAKAQRQQTIRRVRFHFVIVGKKEEHNYHGCNRQFEASVGANQCKFPLMPRCQAGIQQHKGCTRKQNATDKRPYSRVAAEEMPAHLCFSHRPLT